MTARFASLLAVSLLLTGVLTGCECDPPPDLPDAALDAGPLPDGFVPDEDGGMIDGGPGPMGPTITICPGDSLPPLATGICETTAGDGNLLITGDVLTPGEVFRGGQVLVGDDGAIDCVGCDCSGEANAGGATTIVCPDGVVSPGLINGHDHLGFTAGPPTGQTLERYEHRNEWRQGLNGHTRISNGGQTGTDVQLWEELRMTMAGTTAGITEGGREGFVRNLDSSNNEGLSAEAVVSETFILGDLRNPTPMSNGCGGYAELPMASDIAGDDAFVPHLAEGIADTAQNEFECSRAGDNDIIAANTAIIHGVGLRAADIAEIATERTSLIWSPRTNISLYGDTARVTLYDNQGVLIAIGSDWMRSGSMNMLRELRCADDLNRDYFDGYFTDEQLWLMATRNGAVVSSVEEFIGTLAVGMVADIAIYDGSEQGDHRAVLEAGPDDVALVLRSGEVLYGETATVDAIESGCDTIDVCGASRSACVMREIGMSYSDLEAANATTYPLFFCGEPDDEPTCIPSRNAEAPLPSPEVNGSNRYDGMLSDTDMDGDGIPNDSDICPRIFNPIRPLDEGAQADADADGLGDACDPCPLDADTTTCTALNPNDRDNDMVDDTEDNCPGDANMDQADRDGDDIGDVCDACPDDPNPGGASCPGTIYQVKDGTFGDGEGVRIPGSVVTGVDARGFSMQVPSDHPSFTSVDNSGIYVFTNDAPALDDATPIAIGMTVDLDGAVNIFRDQIQLSPSSITASATPGAAIVATAATPAEVAMDGTREATLEGVLVTVSSVTVATETVADGEFTVEDGLIVDDLFFLIEPFVSVGEGFTSITGVLMHRGDTSKLHPTMASDYVAGAPQLLALTPDLSYARVGAGSAPTFPEPLTAHLARAGASDTTVTVTFTGAAGGIVVADVTVPAGMTSAPVPVEGVTEGSYTVNAELGGDTLMADVEVIGAAEAPTALFLMPGPTVTVGADATEPFEVSLDIPAPPGGTLVTLSDATGGTVPATVMIAADELSATFDYVAPSAATSGMLTASALAGTLTAAVTIDVVVTPGTLVFNEVDYNQSGTDAMEYVELYNPGSTPVALAGLQLYFINQTGTPYNSSPIDLSGASASEVAPGGYLLVAVAAVTPANSAVVLNITPATNLIQNGDDDGMFVYDSNTQTVLDAFGYQGSTTFMVDGNTVTMASSLMDAANGDISLSRVPDGAEGATDDVFVNTACLTPGGPNFDSNAGACP